MCILKNERKLFYKNIDDIGLKENYIAYNIMIIKQLSTSFNKYIQKIERVSEDILYFENDNVTKNEISRVDICNNMIILVFIRRQNVSIKVIYANSSQLELLESVGLNIRNRVNISEIDEEKVSDFLNQNINKSKISSFLISLLWFLCLFTVAFMIYGFFTI